MALCHYCCADFNNDQPHTNDCPAQLPAEENAMREWSLGFRDGREEKKVDKKTKKSYYDCVEGEKRSRYYKLGLKVGRAVQILANSETPEVEEIREDCLDFHERDLGVRHGHFDLYKLFRANLKKKPGNDNEGGGTLH